MGETQNLCFQEKLKLNFFSLPKKKEKWKNGKCFCQKDITQLLHQDQGKRILLARKERRKKEFSSASSINHLWKQLHKNIFWFFFCVERKSSFRRGKNMLINHSDLFVCIIS
jgi:hypothetical protein